jgi:hypothetical protein
MGMELLPLPFQSSPLHGTVTGHTYAVKEMALFNSRRRCRDSIIIKPVEIK